MSQQPTEHTLQALLAEAGLPCPPGLPPVTVTGITGDSRRVEVGNLFVAIRGNRTNARDFIPEAVSRGAVAVVCGADDRAPHIPQNTPEEAVPTVTVPDPREALARLLDAYCGHPGRSLRLVGVTGTNGKTSVSAMLRHILRTAGLPCGLIGTTGWYPTMGDGVLLPPAHSTAHGMTTPEPAELYPLLARMARECTARRDEGADDVPVTVVMEVTSHALLQGRVAPLSFDLALFTNLTPEHMDLHGTMEDYYLAKKRLFAAAREGVVNADDRWGRRLLTEDLPVRHWHICHGDGVSAASPHILCPHGEGTCTRLHAEQVKQYGEEGVAFKLTSPDVRLRLRCPIPGRFTLSNALLAASAALALGVSPTAVREALAHFPGVTGRMERVPLPPAHIPFSVYVDFAHTPDALENLLATVHAFRRRDQRIVLVFGCGGDRDRSKRKTMARIASRMADFVVITSDNSRSENPGSIISDILEGIDKESEFAVVPDRAEAIRYAVKHARMGDLILLAGKGHETYEIDSQGMHPFCEKAIAVQAVKDFHPRRRGE